MTVRILRSADRPPMPWKNVGGITHEVATEPPGAGLDDFAWRISFADVARSGPFSAYPGVDRIITLVSGHGMNLTVDGTPYVMTEPYIPFALSGDDSVDCRLVDGPVVDLNVMTRRDVYSATVRITTGRRVIAPEVAEGVGPGVFSLVVALAGAVEVSWAGSDREVVELGVRDAALISGHGEAVTIVPTAFAALVSLTPRQVV
ncbi:MAG TPA: HutD family protein [Actinocrinis sp.]|nr:HutD family protein [Actinocrinis sp.]